MTVTRIWRDIWRDLRTIPSLHARQLIHDEYELDGPPEAIEAALEKLTFKERTVLDVTLTPGVSVELGPLTLKE